VSTSLILGTCSAAAGWVACPLYVRKTLRGGAQPSRVSWASWVLAYTELLVLQAAGGATVTLLLNATEWAATVLILVLTWRRGTGALSAATAALIGCDIAALAAWRLASPAIGTECMLAAIALAAWPTIRREYRAPGTEPAFAWWLLILGGLLSGAGVRPGSPAVLYAYPAVVTAMSAGVVIAGAAGAAAQRRWAARLIGAGVEAAESRSQRPPAPPVRELAGQRARGGAR
jgi:hypothetical protein